MYIHRTTADSAPSRQRERSFRSACHVSEDRSLATFPLRKINGLHCKVEGKIRRVPPSRLTTVLT